jgi:hypothetical protein
LNSFNKELYSAGVTLRYRVREPLLAVYNKTGVETVFMTIAPGSVITVQGIEQQSGFVDVAYIGQSVKVFLRDIEIRADRVEAQIS